MGVEVVGEIFVRGWMELVFYDLDMGIEEEEFFGGSIFLFWLG